MSSTSIVEIAGPGERAFELAKFTAFAVHQDDSESRVHFMEQCKNFVKEGQIKEFILFILNHKNTIFQMDDDEGVQGAFSLVFSFLRAVQGKDKSLVCNDLAAAFTNSKDNASLRIQLLTDLYNLLNNDDESDIKYHVLVELIKFVSSAQMINVLESYFANSDHWVEQWGLSLDKRRNLYLLISSELDKSGDVDEAQAFLIKYLHTFDTTIDENANPAEAREHARAAAIGYIKAPVVSQKSNLPTLRAIKALQNGQGSDPLVFELLCIFAGGNLSDYEAFYGKHSDFIKSLGVEHKTSLHTMRLLTLCTVAATQQSLSLADISSALEVDENDAEGWVIECVSRGLMEAKVDQVSRTVHVARSTQRQFNQEQWVALQTKLKSWKENVSALVKAVKETRNAVKM